MTRSTISIGFSSGRSVQRGQPLSLGLWRNAASSLVSSSLQRLFSCAYFVFFCGGGFGRYLRGGWGGLWEVFGRYFEGIGAVKPPQTQPNSSPKKVRERGGIARTAYFIPGRFGEVGQEATESTLFVCVCVCVFFFVCVCVCVSAGWVAARSHFFSKIQKANKTLSKIKKFEL